MNTYAITQLLAADNYIIVNKSLINTFDLETAVLIGELCSEYNYWYKNNKLDNDSFYSTRENLENNTGLSKYQQQTIIEKLCNLGLLSVTKKGMPAKNYYTIHADILESLLSLGLSGEKIRQQVDTNFDLNNNNINNNNIDNIILSNDNIIPADDISTKSYSKEELKAEFLGSRTPKKQSKRTKGKSLYNKCLDEIQKFTDNLVLQSRLEDYLKIRLNMKDKPIYGVGQWIGLLDKLGSMNNQLAVVRRSIERGWRSFYEQQQWTSYDTSVVTVDRTDEDVEQELSVINKMKEEGKKWEF